MSQTHVDQDLTEQKFVFKFGSLIKVKQQVLKAARFEHLQYFLNLNLVIASDAREELIEFDTTLFDQFRLSRADLVASLNNFLFVIVQFSDLGIIDLIDK